MTFELYTEITGQTIVTGTYTQDELTAYLMKVHNDLIIISAKIKGCIISGTITLEKLAEIIIILNK